MSIRVDRNCLASARVTAGLAWVRGSNRQCLLRRDGANEPRCKGHAWAAKTVRLYARRAMADQLPRDGWRGYFDDLSRALATQQATVEIDGPDLGAQAQAEGLVLSGILIATLV